MKRPSLSTKLNSDGLRYKAKPSGTPFRVTSNNKSCLLCGKHKPGSEGRNRMILGKAQFVCFTCKPAGTEEV